MRIKEVAYFDFPGRRNTMRTLELARERAGELGIKDVVVASTSGSTGVLASKMFRGFNLVVVRHHTGFRRPGFQEMSKKNERLMILNKAKLLTTSHSLSGVERAIRLERNTVGPLEIMADTLRILGQGTKVCLEIAVMAADAGLVPVDRDIISVAGTGHGADTALVLRAAHSNNFFDMFVREIIAKPRCRRGRT